MTDDTREPDPNVLRLSVSLEALLQAGGWKRGCPRQVTMATRAVDARLCKRLKCPACRHRGMEYHPYHRGDSYRVLARCPSCGVFEPM
jgi:hypothetical protein